MTAPDPSQIDRHFDELARRITRKMLRYVRPYSLDELYGLPGRVTWRGLLEATQEYHGDERVRAAMGTN